MANGPNIFQMLLVFITLPASDKYKATDWCLCVCLSVCPFRVQVTSLLCGDGWHCWRRRRRAPRLDACIVHGVADVASVLFFPSVRRPIHFSFHLYSVFRCVSGVVLKKERPVRKADNSRLSVEFVTNRNGSMVTRLTVPGVRRSAGTPPTQRVGRHSGDLLRGRSPTEAW